jgi:glycosyltransferase involved in cell wall biosynthesis
MARPKLTVICPVYNEEVVVPLFYERFRAVREKLLGEYSVDLVFCNNASSDATLESIARIRATDPDVFVLTLSRNVGYQRSVECALRTTKGDLFVVIDVDCEDPPEMIPEFLLNYKEGYDVVYGERVDRTEPTWIKNLRKVFYRVMRSVADENIILDMAEFSLMSAEVRDAIIRDTTSFPFIRASIGRVGFRLHGIPYKREPRVGGETHYNLLGMTIFAVAGILSASTLLLRLPIYVLPFWAAIMAGLALLMMWGAVSWAYPLFLLLLALYVGSTLAFISIYVARIYNNTLGRPNFVIRKSNTYPQP